MAERLNINLGNAVEPEYLVMMIKPSIGPVMIPSYFPLNIGDMVTS